MRVLYVNQTAQMSGAEHSLLTLIEGLRDRVDAEMACPEGDFADAARDRGLPVHVITGTDVNLQLHPVETPKAIAGIVADGRRIAGIGRGGGFDLVHANTTRAGLIATMFAGAGALPTVVHVRDWTPEGAVSSAILQYTRVRASALICISELVAGEFPARPRSTPLHVIHNPIDVQRFDPDRYDRAAARAELGLGEDEVVAAVVAQLTPWKGQEDAIRAVALLAEQHPELRLLVVGSAKFQTARLDNQAYADELHVLPDRLGIADRVRFLGERRDVPEILRALDVLLVPSWKEAFGRIVVEGMAMRLPVVATDVGGPREIVTHGADGLLAAPQDPRAWADALGRLAADPEQRRILGEAGWNTARARFTPAHAADRVAAVYGRLGPRTNGL
ncbi:MAG: glycosyltransferase family 4 protein [Solirubrobacteraceae bacterium]|nr:glycosyltransferase family 4 protein [Solirubrobacteraceae bacterium]